MNSNPGEPAKTFLYLFRGTNWDEGLSNAELEVAVKRFVGWMEELQKSGKMKAGQPLARGGQTISGRGVVADGPFAESKEAVGGYLMVRAQSMDEAMALAKTWPVLDYGGTIEVREVVEECPTFQRVHERFRMAIP